ncbi:aminotransferase class IV [Streptomyces montanisoli]|uniref:Aminotransferase class IV n=1 Tax=Streptomyces montanisoli TaxID=2798581 RepID=A0A940MFL4_9ACTN|nr:aminotransferase class IV [Streptomyces montanisoli]MBP0459973.1 aminotransferase class IV [Streptomyces montanisoli]
MLHVEINGAAPSIADLHRVAVVNYGHFTSMQVRGRRVRGLDLHLRRLEDASKELFLATPGADRIRSLLGQALAQVAGDVSARIAVFAGSGDLSVPTADVDLAVMVSLTDPVPETPQTPWRVRSIPYVRDSAHLKHTATMGLTGARRAAKSQGFDDALFTGPDGLVIEGSIWNLGLWDGETVTWPQAPKLPGITEQLLTSGLHRIGVPTRPRPVVVQDLARYQSAFASYSWCPAQPLASVDDISFANRSEVFTLLGKAWDSVRWETV